MTQQRKVTVMAHYKRRKCRRNCPHAIRGSTTSWRARHGFKPVRLTRFEDEYPHINYWSDRGMWLRALSEHHDQWNGPPGKSHLGQMNGWPAWWDRLFHTRPKRAATKRLERAVLRGLVDPDDLAWPLGSRKPHNYFW